tara:strand:+ start:355 stop:1227 length:873 start_codon:yes stop_codon:yes gene_type:complete
MASRLALGTAQFGLSYGIANHSGQVPHDEVKAILKLARSSGIDTLDTAITYGESEQCLGSIGIDEQKVVTKIPSIPDNIKDVNLWVFDQMEASLSRLNTSSVYGLLLHHSDQLLGKNGKALAQAMGELKSKGVVKKIGVSIYNPFELEDIINNYEIDLVQAPFNLIDRRIQTSGWLHKLKKEGIEVHTRSIFLQGLLLIPAIDFPEKFNSWLPLFNIWHEWLIDNNISATQACMAFGLSHSEISRMIVGVESKQQLNQLIDIEANPLFKSWPDIKCLDENLINPSTWNKL